ncbi:MAG: hypothetical protein KAR07_02580 [Spirochaetes bacterium]|nr:hypothetical protein [Spirochaetota bacterium]
MSLDDLQYQENDVGKMKGFIARLFLNPNFQNLPLPEVEGLLINFLKQNEQQLIATLTSDEFYPGLQWRDVQILFFTVLKEITLEKMMPQMKKLISEKIELSFLTRLDKKSPVNISSISGKILAFLEKIVANREVRTNFDVTFKLLENDYIDKYVESLFKRREYLFNELTRVDSLHHLDAIALANYVKTALVLRNVVYMKLPVSQNIKGVGTVSNLNLFDVWDRPALKQTFLDKLHGVLFDEFPEIPEEFLKAAIDSNRDCNEETSMLSGCSRFLAIISKRGKDYKPWIKVDRGAEQPDKSWFTIARKNYRHHGLDKKMLEEFFKISADGNW